MKVTLNNLCLLSIFISIAACSENVESISEKYSGLYEQVSIAIAPDMHITGVFKEERGDNFSCIIGFTGKLIDGKAKIKTTEEHYDGELQFQDNSILLKIPKGQDYPGCGMTIGPDIATGIEFWPREATDWIEIKIVPANDVALRKEPNSDSDVLELLKKWHVLGVLEHKNNWSKVSFYKVDLVEDKIVKGFKEGWVETSSLKSVE